MKIILASASERRKDLLKRIIKSFEIRISNFNEKSVIFDMNIEKYVEKLSEGKAQNISENLKEDSIIIGCDTVVYFNNEILGKPKNKQDAVKMLEMLSGNVHKVYSGITLLNNKTKKVISDHVCTEVKFSKIDKNEIFKYIDTGEPMDKAGAYGIQGYGGVFVEKINGCYYNVVGLPLNKLSFMLKEMGVNL